MKKLLKVVYLLLLVIGSHKVSAQGGAGIIYKTDSVTFTGSKTGIQYGATLTLPKVNKPCPAMVIISGTGKQDRDGTMAGHKLFLTIANYLSERGIAVLRVDDRGTGKTTGVYETATTADFANDALSAVAYLKTIKGIDPHKIGLLGHSEGGAAISIAAANCTDIKFLVSVAGLATSGYEAQILQNEALVNSAPIPAYDKKRFNQVDSLMFKTALQYADTDDMEKRLMDTYEVWRKKDSVYFQSLHVQFDHFRFPIYSWSKTAAGPWYRYFIKYDPANFLSKVKVPILALNGDKDIMVAYKENLDNWKKYPAMEGNKDVTVIVMPGLNHLFLPCVKCTIQEYPEIKSDFSPGALKIIADWINKRFN